MSNDELRTVLLGRKTKYPATKRVYFGGYAHAKNFVCSFIRAVVAVEQLFKKGNKGVQSVDICLPAHKLGKDLNEIKVWLEAADSRWYTSACTGIKVTTPKRFKSVME